MGFGVTGFGDLSNNKYAAYMKEVANGLAGWSGVLLFIFFIYQLISNDYSSFFSLSSLLVIVIGETIFVVTAGLGNKILSIVILPFVMLLSAKGKLAMAQNILSTILVFFGLFLCVFAWFFASYSVSYAYPAPSMPNEAANSSELQEISHEPYSVHCSQPLPVFTLGRYSNPTKEQECALCECIWERLGQWERGVAEKLSQGRGSEISELHMKAFPYRFGRALEKCGGLDL